MIREGIVRDSPFGGKQESVDVETEELVTDDHRLTAPMGIRLTIFSKRADEEEAQSSGGESPLLVYTYGERLHLIREAAGAAKLRQSRSARPGRISGIAGHSADGVGASRGTSRFCLDSVGSRIGLWRSNARRSVLNHIQRLWPGEPGALMQAMLIGGRAFFGRELKTNFQRTGTYHILVVSGINVGILAFAFFWALRRLPMGEAAATVLTILFSWGYAFLADLGPPIVRATITLTIYLLTRLLFRDRNGLNALGIAALGILVVAPRTLFEASFQLTFLSVIAVAGIAVPILQRTLYPFSRALRNIDSPGFDFSLPTRAAQFRSDLRLVRENLAQIVGLRVSNFVLLRGVGFVLAAAELILISAIIEVSLALPMAWYFHRTTTMSLPANVLVIPLAGILMPTAVLAVALVVCLVLAGASARAHRRILTGGAHGDHSLHRASADCRCSPGFHHNGISSCRSSGLWGGNDPGSPAFMAGLVGRRRVCWHRPYGSRSRHPRSCGAPACWRSPRSMWDRAIRC